MNLLHHGADEAGELGDVAAQKLFAKIDVSQKAVQRIADFLIGRGFENLVRNGGPILSRRDRHIFFRFEVMKERALGDSRRFAKVIDRRRGIALRADHFQCRVQNFFACIRTSCRLGQESPQWLYHTD